MFIKRPIFWGIVLFVSGFLGWWVSVIFNVITLGQLRWLSNFFGIIFIASLPAALAIELILWLIRRKK